MPIQTFRDAAHADGVTVTEKMKRLSLPGCPAGQEPADLESGVLFWNTTTDGPRIKNNAGNFVDLASGGSVPNLSPARFMARPDGGATPTTGIANTTARDLLAGAAQCRVPEDFGAVGDGVTNDTVALQAAIDYCVLNNFPLVLTKNKTYLTTARLQIGTGSAIAQLCMRAQQTNTGIPNIRYTGGQMAINIQGAREVLLDGVVVQGVNFAPSSAAASGIGHQPSPNVANYVSSGLSRSRWAPHAGITIDAFSGTDPGAGYAGATYGQYSSIGVTLRGCVVYNFVVGFLNLGDVGNAESIQIENCTISHCAYLAAVCQTQARNNVFTDLRACTQYHTGFDGLTFGAQNGSPPTVTGGVLVAGARLFNISTAYGAFYCTGLYCETTISLGTVTGPEPCSFTGCTFYLYQGTPQYEAVVHGRMSTLSATFRGCAFSTGFARLNLIGGGSGGHLVFEQCRFISGYENDAEYHVCHRLTAGNQKVTLRECNIGGNPIEGWNTKNESADIRSPNYRLALGQGTRWIRTGGVAAGNLAQDMRVQLAAPEYRAIGLAASAHSWASGTLTFTAVAGEFRVGDILYWPLIQNGAMDANTSMADMNVASVPCLKVTVVAGTTITAVCEGSYTELDRTLTPNPIYVCFRDYAFNTAAALDTTNASPNAVLTPAGAGLLPNDFIRAVAGLPAIVRVVSNDGAGNVVLSKNATATRVAEAIYLSKLIAL